jgi:hypothetical protein
MLVISVAVAPRTAVVIQSRRRFISPWSGDHENREPGSCCGLFAQGPAPEGPTSERAGPTERPLRPAGAGRARRVQGPIRPNAPRQRRRGSARVGMHTRDALTRGPCSGRRDRAEPLARPTRSRRRAARWVCAGRSGSHSSGCRAVRSGGSALG